MTTIAIVGAGHGLGAAVARRFGAEGFSVALISRSQEHVDALAIELTSDGLTARGYAANVRDRDALAAALARAGQELGTIEVLEYSPLPQREFLRPVLETTTEDLAAAVEFSIYGPVTAVGQVLPGMRSLGRGSVLFVNGGSGALAEPEGGGHLRRLRRRGRLRGDAARDPRRGERPRRTADRSRRDHARPSDPRPGRPRLVTVDDAHRAR